MSTYHVNILAKYIKLNVLKTNYRNKILTIILFTMSQGKLGRKAIGKHVHFRILVKLSNGLLLQRSIK